MSRKTIQVNYLARVEGEGALRVVIRDGRVQRAELSIFEPPRFFEALLRGRDCSEAPDITARICGICPVAYQMSAVHAIERALGIEVTGALRELRRLLYCGEWIESHALHIYLLHAPDFLGYAGGIDMAREHPEQVRLGLGLKQAGNRILALLGGREIHPINVRIGGFYKVPERAALQELVEPLQRAREAALATLEWAAEFDFPERERDYVFVALRHPHEYPFNEGRILSNRGLDIDAEDYEREFGEIQVAHSTAYQSRQRDGASYLVGPLARYSLNFDRLFPEVQRAACAAGLGPQCRNPYRSILVRAVEVLQACTEALRIIETYRAPAQPAVPFAPRAGTGWAATEAPRGLLYHRYRLNADGSIAAAHIVPPTAQNQSSIEEDLASYIEGFLDLPDDALRHRCEQTVRNYDPCISCATHFLRLELDRG